LARAAYDRATEDEMGKRVTGSRKKHLENQTKHSVASRKASERERWERNRKQRRLTPELWYNDMTPEQSRLLRGLWCTNAGDV
jgi:hypothetical protein